MHSWLGYVPIIRWGVVGTIILSASKSTHLVHHTVVYYYIHIEKVVYKIASTPLYVPTSQETTYCLQRREDANTRLYIPLVQYVVRSTWWVRGWSRHGLGIIVASDFVLPQSIYSILLFYVHTFTSINIIFFHAATLFHWCKVQQLFLLNNLMRMAPNSK